MMAALAVGALLAGCVGVAAGAPVDAEGGEGADEAGPPVPQLPDAWDATLSVESLPASDGTRYLVLQHLYGELAESDSMGPEALLRTEFLASQSAECEGTATLAGESAHCMLQADVYGGSSGPKVPAEVRLVPAASGASALLIGVDEEGPEPLVLADRTPLGLRTIDGTTPEEVTPAQLEGAVIDAVALAAQPDGPLSEALRVRCEVLEEGRHAVCEVTGTDGGGGGLWYATVQPGLVRIPGDGTTYLFSQLPA